MNILLDLDGVLSDFFTEAFNRCLAVHGHTSERGNSSTVEHYVKSFGRFEMHDYFCISPTQFWSTIESPDNFWSSLEPFPWAGELLDILHSVGEVTICTSPSLNPTCTYQKLSWLRRHFNIPPTAVMIGSRKYLMARPGNILIDDHAKNVNEFRQNGATAYWVGSNWNTLNLSLDHILDELPISTWKQAASCTSAR